MITPTDGVMLSLRSSSWTFRIRRRGSSLYPDFTPSVAKYGDNGLARSEEELSTYFAAYRRRAPLEFLRHRLEMRSVGAIRSYLSMDSAPSRLVKRAYYMMKGR